MCVGLVLHYRRALSLTYNASLFVYYTRLSHPPLVYTSKSEICKEIVFFVFMEEVISPEGILLSSGSVLHYVPVF